MALIVQKFGGTSVGSVDRINAVAKKVGEFRDRGDDVIVVVSAMSGETNRLTALAQGFISNPASREMDVLLSTGEQVTISLLAMALESRGYRAISYTGAQVKILTDSFHTKARIKEIDTTDIYNANKLGYKIKLLGFAEQLNNIIYQRVHPTLIKKDSYVASIDGVLNAVIIDGKPVGQSIIQGEGAGPAATTSALISDISSILRGNVKFPFSVSGRKRKKLKFNNIEERFFSSYMRFEVTDKPGVLSNITSIFSKNKVSIKRLIQNPNKNKKISSIIIITHKSKNKFLNKILREVAKKNFIKKKPKLKLVLTASPPFLLITPKGAPSKTNNIQATGIENFL